MNNSNTRLGCLQIGLALVALAYVASLWLFPQWDPLPGLVLVLGLAAAGGVVTFVVAVRDAHTKR